MSDAVRVLDASAVLCLVLDEPGAETVKRMLPAVAISAVNVSEVAAKLSDHGMPFQAIEEMMASLDLRTEAFTNELARNAARLRGATRSAGLSLGDRACLATAMFLGGAAVTADRAWAKIGAEVGVEIELVR